MGELKDRPPLNCKRNSLWITFRKLMFFLTMWWYFQQVKQLTTCINHNSSKSQRIRPRFCRFAGLAVLYCIATLERADSTRKGNFQKRQKIGRAAASKNNWNRLQMSLKKYAICKIYFQVYLHTETPPSTPIMLRIGTLHLPTLTYISYKFEILICRSREVMIETSCDGFL